MDYRLLIIGGGASGLAAAVEAAASGMKGVAILEKLPRTGKKILVTGNGRCNLSHTGLTAADYYGTYDPAPVLQAFGTAESFFENLGLYTRTDSEGRMYPYSMTATAVLDALRMHLGSAEELCGQTVTDLVPYKHGWRVQTDHGIMTADSVIFAAGGHAAPKHGTDGSAWQLLEQLDIPIISPRPILCPVHSDAQLLRPLKGLRVRCQVTLLDREHTLYEERGEVQFTETALSGICMFDLAGNIDMHRLEDFRIQLDLLPDKKEEDALSMLYTLQGTRFSRSSEEMMTGLLQRPVARLVLKNAHIRADQLCSELNDRQLRGIARELKHLRFPVTGTADFSQAQATAGGVRGDALDDFLMLRAHPGLYVTGEAVDVQSICGGYHLHWCWASGCRAAAHLAGGSL